MKVLIDKSFEKDIRKIKELKLRSKIALIIESMMIAKKLEDIHQIKKLRGGDIY
ncbi:MAG: hypothetical protein ABIQ02_02370 [Saprospiraceae bacterium]